MALPSIRAALAGLGLAAALAPGFAAAHPPRGRFVQPDGYAYADGDDDRTAQGYGFNPYEGLQPNGCVKQCEFDMNPCDPPSYKHADGRCTYDR